LENTGWAATAAVAISSSASSPIVIVRLIVFSLSFLVT
jgi:hypothetical protein